MNWCVGVAEHRRDELAELELDARGFEVHVPRKWTRERTIRDNRFKLTAEPLIAPYFYVLFDPKDQDQYSLVLRQRGVSHVLESKPGLPGIVPATIIAEHKERERAEKANTLATKARGRRDLHLTQSYVITRHELFKGTVGKLFALSGGLAYLDCARMTVIVPEADIAPVMPPEPAKAAA